MGPAWLCSLLSVVRRWGLWDERDWENHKDSLKQCLEIVAIVKEMLYQNFWNFQKRDIYWKIKFNILQCIVTLKMQVIKEYKNYY